MIKSSSVIHYVELAQCRQVSVNDVAIGQLIYLELCQQKLSDIQFIEAE